MRDFEPKATAAANFVARFDDFFECGIHPSIAYGILLTWMWVGLTEGYPVFMDGRIDLASVVILLGSFAACVLAVGFLRPIAALMRKPGAWAALCVIASATCLLLLLFPFHLISLEGSWCLAVIRLAMVVLGVCAGVLLMCCATGFACLSPASAGIAYVFAVAVTFAVFFCLIVCGPRVKGLLFCLLPLIAGLVLLRTRKSITDRLLVQPNERLPFARGFVEMCVSFAVFFFAIGAKCAMEPVSEFAEDSNTSIVGILIVAVAFLYAIGLRQKPVGVFRALKLSYSIAVMVLTVCIALAPLSIEPYVGVVYNADVMVMIMVLWLLTAFVSYSNETYVGKVAALALGMAALGMAAGWFSGTMIYQVLGHSRSYPTIAIACATAVFSTVGFSSKSFPYLTRRGEGARKMRQTAGPYEPADYCKEASAASGLSERESEVLALLVSGYGADAVSEKLVISYHTARTHVRNIYRKMDVHSQRELLDAYEAAKVRHEGERPGR